jgi:hypothetical protein
MFCSSCGLEQPQELSYCSRCGNNLRPAGPDSSGSPVRSKFAIPAIAGAMVLITLGGFGMIFGLVMALIEAGNSLSLGGMILIALTLVVILTVDWLLLRFLMRLLHFATAGPGVVPAQPKHLSEPAQHRLAEPLQPIDSVTEYTTRTLGPVLVDRKEPR